MDWGARQHGYKNLYNTILYVIFLYSSPRLQRTANTTAAKARYIIASFEGAPRFTRSRQKVRFA